MIYDWFKGGTPVIEHVTFQNENAKSNKFNNILGLNISCRLTHLQIIVAAFFLSRTIAHTILRMAY